MVGGPPTATRASRSSPMMYVRDEPSKASPRVPLSVMRGRQDSPRMNWQRLQQYWETGTTVRSSGVRQGATEWSTKRPAGSMATNAKA